MSMRSFRAWQDRKLYLELAQAPQMPQVAPQIPQGPQGQKTWNGLAPQPVIAGNQMPPNTVRPGMSMANAAPVAEEPNGAMDSNQQDPNAQPTEAPNASIPGVPAYDALINQLSNKNPYQIFAIRDQLNRAIQGMLSGSNAQMGRRKDLNRAKEMMNPMPS